MGRFIGALGVLLMLAAFVLGWIAILGDIHGHASTGMAPDRTLGALVLFVLGALCFSAKRALRNR